MPDLPTSPATELLLEALDLGQHPFLSVTSDSMAPLIRRGDRLQLGSISLDALEQGDVIVIGSGDDLLAHRLCEVVVEDNSSFLLTRGDRLAYYDPPFPAGQLQAIVIARRRSDWLLGLASGPGAWLNRRLARLSTVEAWVIGLRRPVPGLHSQGPTTISLIRRGLRRVLVTLAVILTLAIERLSASEGR